MAQEPSFFSGPEHEPFSLIGGPAGVLLIHGFIGTPAEVRPLAERLAAAGFSAYAPLLPGFGSDIARLGDSDRKQWLSAVDQAWREVRRNHETAFLAGYSMGGALAILAAVAHPPAGLVLLSPFTQMGGWQFRLLPVLKRVFPTIAPFEKADFDDPAIRDQLAAIVPGVELDDPATQQYFRTQVRLPLAVLDEVRRLGNEARRSAPHLETPVLVLQGEDDITVTPAGTRRLVARVRSPVTYLEVMGDHSFIRLDKGKHDYSPEVVSFLNEFSQTRPETLPGYTGSYAS